MSESLNLHLNPDEIELWALGLLPAARALHLAQCAACLTAAERERKLFRELIQLERFAPSAGFAEKVMARVQILTAKTVNDGQ
jgi:hypothetical protein